MQHDLHLRGHAFSLRPVTLDDAAFILRLRSGGGPYINRGAQSEAAQRSWIERYFTTQDDYYFVVERNRDQAPQGTVSVYDMAPGGKRAQWGRFVMTPGSVGAIEAALLIFRCAFETLELEVLYCRTLTANATVLAFFDSCGLVREDALVPILHNGVATPAVGHILTRERFETAVQPHLDRMAARLAARPAPPPARTRA